jgi:glycosyltransferase involved in cell wall biosynthesis
MKTRVCAIMSAYNEADVIHESIQKLIQQEVDVYLLDNGSTDDTVEIANQFLNKGLIKVERCVFTENGKEVYDWTALLKRKEELSRQLDYDWFMHVDADEIRYSPWAHRNLREGIELVDQMGFNLINFRLFNFRLTHEKSADQSIEEALTHYSTVEQFNRMQVKAWKKSSGIDLVSHAGHLALLPQPKIFPIRFIHKHYPVRSIEQGTRKIIKERLARYSTSDRRKGWHVQYDHMSADLDQIRQELIWNAKELKKFDAHEITNELFMDASKLLAYYATGSGLETFHINQNTLNQALPNAHLIAQEVKTELLGTAHNIVKQIKQGHAIQLDLNEDTQEAVSIIAGLIESQAMADYMRGDPALFDNIHLFSTASSHNHRQLATQI